MKFYISGLFLALAVFTPSLTLGSPTPTKDIGNVVADEPVTLSKDFLALLKDKLKLYSPLTLEILPPFIELAKKENSENLAKTKVAFDESEGKPNWKPEVLDIIGKSVKNLLENFKKIAEDVKKSGNLPAPEVAADEPVPESKDLPNFLSQIKDALKASLPETLRAFEQLAKKNNSKNVAKTEVAFDESEGKPKRKSKILHIIAKSVTDLFEKLNKVAEDLKKSGKFPIAFDESERKPKRKSKILHIIAKSVTDLSKKLNKVAEDLIKSGHLPPPEVSADESVPESKTKYNFSSELINAFGESLPKALQLFHEWAIKEHKAAKKV